MIYYSGFKENHPEGSYKEAGLRHYFRTGQGRYHKLNDRAGQNQRFRFAQLYQYAFSDVPELLGENLQAKNQKT